MVLRQVAGKSSAILGYLLKCGRNGKEKTEFRLRALRASFLLLPTAKKTPVLGKKSAHPVSPSVLVQVFTF